MDIINYHAKQIDPEIKIKAFKRLLKMTGLYSLWVENRKNERIKYRHFRYEDKNPFIFIKSYMNAGGIIHNSFEWVKTERLTYSFWETLESIFDEYVDLRTFLKDNNNPKYEKMVDEIKELINKHRNLPKDYGYQ